MVQKNARGTKCKAFIHYVFRFGCLDIGLRFRDPCKCCTVIQACLVLHNIATKRRDFIDPKINSNLDEEPEDIEILEDDAANEAGKTVRNFYAMRYFDRR